MKNYLFELNVSDLYDSEKIFLWSIREWLLCIRLAKDPRECLINSLSKCRMQEAVLPVDNIMTTLAYFTSSPIDIRCHCSEEIGKHEIDLLCLLSITQIKMDFKLDKIIEYLEKKDLIQLNKNCNKLIKIFNKANLFFLIRRNLILSYNILNHSNENIIYFDFKTKTIH